MKKTIYVSTLFCLLFTLGLSAQPTSKLTPEKLTFSDLSNGFANSSLDLGSLNIVNGFNSTHISDNSVSSGSDLLRSTIDGNGFTIQDFALFPGSHSNLNRKKLTFITEGQGVVGLDKETWTFGITDVGAFDANDAVQSALSLTYSRIIDDIAILFPILFVNPDKGNVGIGTFDKSFSAQLFVDEYSQNQVGVWSDNVGIANSAKWGIYSTAEGSGSGIRYGVVGSANTSTGIRYGVYGQSFGAGTQYAVYANGNLAYTGTFSLVSDRKFKKNIRDFTALDRVMHLRPKTYDMKQEEFKRMNLAAGTQFGFIAQELQEVFPELVHENVNAIPYQGSQDTLVTEEIKYLGVDYISLVPVLTKAMQEQQKMLEEKEERITKLERDNEAIQQKNAALEDRLDQLEILVQQLAQNSSGQSGPHTVSDAQLMQNQPNPFSTSTSIPHFVPEGVKKAVLQIADAGGRVLKSIVVQNRGFGQTLLDTNQLSGGTYFYTLILDGKILDTKKMLLVGE